VAVVIAKFVTYSLLVRMKEVCVIISSAAKQMAVEFW
jgi:hypothetical protein